MVGERIRRVLQTPWCSYDDVFACSVFVELENGFVFELQSQDTFEDNPIDTVIVDETDIMPAK